MDEIAMFKKYMQRPEVKKKSSAAKEKAWTQLPVTERGCDPICFTGLR